MRLFFLFFSTVVLLASLISFTGCSREESEYVIKDLPIDDIEILISRDAYQSFAHIIVLVHGSVLNSCESPYETRHHWQDSNTVTIEIKTKEVIDDSLDCSANIVEHQIPVYIGWVFSKHSGKYKVIVNGIEKEFRVD